MTRAPLNWPVRIRRPERALVRRVVVVIVVALVVVISGVLVLRGYLKQQASVHVSQAEVDSLWLHYIDEALSGTQIPNSELSPQAACPAMRRVANGEHWTIGGGGAEPSKSVAAKFVSELCKDPP
jgi:hypothetical protein